VICVLCSLLYQINELRFGMMILPKETTEKKW